MSAKNRTCYKSLDRLARDPRVVEIWSEESFGDGLWISLANGWNCDGASVVHEQTVRDLREAFKHIARGATY
jgi:hypothetical protein